MQRSVWFSGGLAFAAILGVSFLSTPASAAVYDWTISGGDGLSGSGTITLSSTPTDTPAGTGYLVTGITGSLGSDDFSSRAVLGTFDSGGVNNIIYYPTLADGFVVDDFGRRGERQSRTLQYLMLRRQRTAPRLQWRHI